MKRSPARVSKDAVSPSKMPTASLQRKPKSLAAEEPGEVSAEVPGDEGGAEPIKKPRGVRMTKRSPAAPPAAAPVAGIHQRPVPMGGGCARARPPLMARDRAKAKKLAAGSLTGPCSRSSEAANRRRARRSDRRA